MKDNDIPEKSDFYKFGVNIPVPTVRLSNKHPCYGCVWYDKNADVLFCPFHNCVRNKKALKFRKRWRNEMLIKRGDIFYADLDPVVGSEQGGVRPVLVVQNNIGNRHSPTLVVLPLSTVKKNKLPTHICIRNSKILPKDSVILAEQIRTIDRSRLRSYIDSLDSGIINKIDEAMKISIGVDFDD